MRVRVAWLLWCCLLPAWLLAADQAPVPELKSPVTDLTQTLTAEQSATLERSLRAFEQRKGSQIAVLLVPTTQPESIEQYSIRVVNAWKLGRKGVDDGALLIVAKNDHGVRIEVGYGLEGVLNDATTSRIIRYVITPHFRNGEFFEGISEGTQRLMQVIDGEVLPEPTQQRVTKDIPWPLLIFAVIVGGSLLRALLGRLGAASVTAAGVGLMLWWFIGTMMATIVGGLFAFIFVLAGGGRGGGWSNGPRGGSFGSGGFGGGGWSGGGGGFGGGGASGKW